MRLATATRAVFVSGSFCALHAHSPADVLRLVLLSDSMSLSNACRSARHSHPRDARNIRHRHSIPCSQRSDTVGSQGHSESKRDCRSEIGSPEALPISLHFLQCCPSDTPSSLSACRRPSAQRLLLVRAQQLLVLLQTLLDRRCLSCTAITCASAVTSAARASSRRRPPFSFERLRSLSHSQPSAKVVVVRQKFVSPRSPPVMQNKQCYSQCK